MGYCKWTDSDIFLYPDEIDGKIVCFQCQLECFYEDDKPIDREFYDRNQALAHVEQHLVMGDTVPERVLTMLREEIQFKGNEIKEEVYDCTSGFAEVV